jgi:hypothetical protein
MADQDMTLRIAIETVLNERGFVSLDAALAKAKAEAASFAQASKSATATSTTGYFDLTRAMQGLPQVQAAATTGAKQAGDALRETGMSAASLGYSVQNLMGQFAALASAGALVAFLKSAYIEAAADARAMNALMVQVQQTGQAHEWSRPKVEEFISALEDETGIVHDKLIPAFQRLVLVTGDVRVSQDLLTVAAKYAVNGIGDVESNARSLGMALQTGVGRSLRVFGIETKAAGGEAADLASMLQLVFDKADQMPSHFEDAQARLDHWTIAWVKFKEAVGGAADGLASMFIHTRGDAIKATAEGLTYLNTIIAKAEASGDTQSVRYTSMITERTIKEKLLATLRGELEVKTDENIETRRVTMVAALSRTAEIEAAKYGEVAASRQVEDAKANVASIESAKTTMTTRLQLAKATEKEIADAVAVYDKPLEGAKVALAQAEATKRVEIAKKAAEQESRERRTVLQTARDVAEASLAITEKGSREELAQRNAMLSAEYADKRAAIDDNIKDASRHAEAIVNLDEWMRERRLAILHDFSAAAQATEAARLARLQVLTDKIIAETDREVKERSEAEKRFADYMERLDERIFQQERSYDVRGLQDFLKQLAAERRALDKHIAELRAAGITEVQIEKQTAAAKIKIAEIENKTKGQLIIAGVASAVQAWASAFPKNKNLAIANTIISTYEAAQKSYDALADIPYIGPVLGGIAAAAAVAAGMARVQQIRSTGAGFDKPEHDLMAKVGGKRWSGDMVRQWDKGVTEGWNEGMARTAFIAPQVPQAQRGGRGDSVVNNNSNWAPATHTTVNVHGFIGAGKTDFMKTLKRELDRVDRQIVRRSRLGSM